MIITIIITIIWTLGSVFFAGLCYFFNGMWGEGKIVWLKIIGWPFYLAYRIFYNPKKRK